MGKEKRTYFSWRPIADRLAGLSSGVPMNTRQIGFAIGMKRTGSLASLRALLYVGKDEGWFTLEKRSNRNYVWTRVGKFTGQDLWNAFIGRQTRIKTPKVPVPLDDPKETKREDVAVPATNGVMTLAQMRSNIQTMSVVIGRFRDQLDRMSDTLDRLLG